MKVRKKNRKSGCVFIICFMCILTLLQSLPVQAKEKKDVKMNVSVNFGKYVKLDRFTYASVELRTGKHGFKGYVQAILYRNGIQDNSMYQKRVSMDAGSMKSVSMELPVLGNLKKIIFRLVDLNGKEILRKTELLKVEKDPTVSFLGIIGEDESRYPKTEGKMFKLITIPYDKIPKRVLGFDSMEAVYIGRNMLEEQPLSILSGVRDWVEDGGTVVVGVENQFLENYLGVGNEKATTIKDNTGKPIYNVMKHSRGVVIEWVYEKEFFDMFRDNTEYVKDVLYGLRTYYSKCKLDKIYQEVYINDSGENNLVKSLEMLERYFLPKPIVDAVFILGYAFIAGPLLYFILKKRKKTLFYYGGVAGVATVFIIMLVLFSVKYDLDEFIIHSVTIYKYESDNNNVQEDTFFSIVLPNSVKEKFSIKKKTDIILKNASLDSCITSAKNNTAKLYNVSIQDAEKDSTVVINDPLYMKPYVFESVSSFETNADICSSLKFDGKNISGYMENHLGYDLENAVLLSNYRIVPLGSFDAGTHFNVEGKQKIVHGGDLYTKSEAAREIMPSLSTKFNQEYVMDHQKYAAMQYCLKEKCFDFNNESYVVGFIKTGTQKSEIEQGKKNKDIRLIVYHLKDIEKKHGNQGIITDIAEYEHPYMGGYDHFTRRIDNYNVVMEYYFPPDKKIDKLVYYESLNKDKEFHGTISIYNQKDQAYETIFSNGKNQSVDKLREKNYISDNNRIVLKYSLYEQEVNTQRNSLPIISLLEEEE